MGYTITVQNDEGEVLNDLYYSYNLCDTKFRKYWYIVDKLDKRTGKEIYASIIEAFNKMHEDGLSNDFINSNQSFDLYSVSMNNFIYHLKQILLLSIDNPNHTFECV